MPAIAIVDDRKSDRETIARVVSSTLKSLKADDKWTVVCADPPTRERDIIAWLDEHDATVLVTDWKLNEGAKAKQVVNYEADSLIREIRLSRPTFPIFVVTGFKSEAEAHLEKVEGIQSRQDFARNAETVVPQMMRAGQRRYEEQRKHFGRMDELARAVATGAATKSQKKELQQLQGYFQAESPMLLSIASVLDELEKTAKKAEQFKVEIERRIAKRKVAKKK